MNQIPKVQDFYKQKSWCDAKDTLGVWRVGRIRKRTKTIVVVHFDGWSDKWKQIYCLHSTLIAPFRMHSKGYTGQLKKPLRDWDYNEDAIKTSEGIMTILVHDNFSGLAPYELTLFLRGDLYIQVDSLMCHTYNNPSKEVSRVVEFFNGIIDMIIKWMSVVPGEIKNCDSESPDKYLYSKSDAICKAIYEILDMLSSIFGFTSRTMEFFERNKQYVTAKIFIHTFLNKEGMKHFINILKVISLENLWHTVVNIPAIFSISTVVANGLYIMPLTECLINQIECLPLEAISFIIEDQDNVSLFMKNMENMIDLVSSPHQKENYMEFFRNFFRMQNLQTNNYEQDSVPELKFPLISPRNKPPAFPTSRRLSSKTSPLKRPEAFKESLDLHQEIPINSINYIKQLIERRHFECVQLIESRISTRKETQKSLEIVFKDHSSCDEQEFYLFGVIEFLITEDKLDEAMKVIKWRKKILKIAALNGWEIAQEVGRITFYKLEIDSSDIFKASMKVADSINRN
ncbi:hypothetical protein SteCoe_27019 [Stentor coeruleus]|uniref:Uncharacterized protein n=1 Tax=Stentor coeruleus TaxID=5963 RepID=A0A1R2BBG2_9CILI|nr:hypothetical protein SteCoe_27019 [Stentor coeruleus]